MKIKLSAAIQARETLNKLAACTKMPIAMSWKMSKLLKEMQNDYDLYEEKRKALIIEFGKADEQGNTAVAPENMTVFIEKINELMLQEIEISDNQFGIDEFKDEFELSPADLLNISFLIKE